jgi:hypothetical protein
VYFLLVEVIFFLSLPKSKNKNRFINKGIRIEESDLFTFLESLTISIFVSFFCKSLFIRLPFFNLNLN